MRSHVIAVGLTCFLAGLLVQAAATAQSRRPTYSPDLVKGKDPKQAAADLLQGALQLAGNGSWERIAVGRAWYLGGDKARGQAILDQVTGVGRVEGSDWFRIGRIYAEAGEWDKAQVAFDKFVAADPGDDSGILEYGALANVNNDRAKAEALIDRAMKESPREFWHWVGAGGSYLGVRPQ
jgi:tetratricopeptide (TPR) repeat protein